MDNEQTEIALDKLEAVFEEKANETGMDIIESARITLAHKSELSDSQMRWLKRNIRIHKINIEGERHVDPGVVDELEDIHGEVCRINAKIERVLRQIRDLQ